MVKIRIISDNKDWSIDLENQIRRYVIGAEIVEDLPDVVVCNEVSNTAEDLHRIYGAIPVIFITASDEKESDNLNIYMYKPIHLMKLLDVIRSANNRLDNSQEGCLTFNNYRLSPNKREIEDLTNGKIFKLTEKEVGLIKHLYKNSANFVSKSDLQTNVWGYNEGVTTHTIETHIYRLRQKVEVEDRRLIITDNGGYQLKMDDDA